MGENFSEGQVDSKATPGWVYDPLKRENLGRSVLWALVASNPVPLGDIPQFPGCGIYALYYTGDSELYEPISSLELQVPIYVGKADPSGSRKGGEVHRAWEGFRLRDRLNKHARTIEAAKNLDLIDFQARYLPADDLFTPMAERLMISELKPVWNMILEGFGVNPPGKKRIEGRRPKWHQVHPGVSWAEGMPERPGGAPKLEEEVRLHLKTHGPERKSASGVPLNLVPPRIGPQ